jgi:hypothetical protein
MIPSGLKVHHQRQSVPEETSEYISTLFTVKYTYPKGMPAGGAV